MVQRIVISGYYGFKNLGDEAVLYSMLQALRSVMPDLRPTVLSNDPPATAQDYGVHAVNRWSLREVAAALRGSDLLISGGGSLLQDVTGLKSLMYYLGVIWLARFYRKPVFYYAQGIGPVNSGAGRRLVALTTAAAKTVTVRDEESMRDLREMGVKRPVYVTADPVLGLAPQDIDLQIGRDILRRNGINPGDNAANSTNTMNGSATNATATAIAEGANAANSAKIVGVSVRPLPGQAGWEMEVARACDRLARSGFAVVFIPMQKPADLVLSTEVAAAMREPSTIISDNLNVPQTISLVGNCSLLLGMRLHALIFAAVCGVIPLGIAYDPKVERFLARINLQPVGRPENLDANIIMQKAEHYLADYTNTKLQMNKLVDEIRQSARHTAELVNGAGR